MQVTVNKLSPVLVELDVALPVERVKSELDKAYLALGKSARVPGFRPGKAPRRVLAHMFGSRVVADVARRLMDETFPQAVLDQKIQPVTSPAVEPGKLVESQPFSYKARVEIIPEIASVTFEGLPAKRPKLAVTDEQITVEVEKLRKQHSTLEPLVEPRPVQKGDTVVIDFTVEVAGEAAPDAGQTDFQVELGSGNLLTAIDDAVTGKNVGDCLDVPVDMPAAHSNKRLAGKQAVFKIALKDVKQRVLADLDDEFAKDVSDHDTLEALRQSLSDGLKKQLDEQGENQLAEQLVAELVKANPIPVPPSLVERQAQITEQEIVQQARRQGLQATGVGDELRGKIHADSEMKVRAGLLMAEIAKKAGIKIGDEDIEKGLVELAEQTGKNVAKLRVEYRDQKKRELLIGMILENKVLDIIQAKAKIEDA